MCYTNSLVCHSLWRMPATFQRVMDVVLSSLKCKFAPVFFDDIVIISWTLRVHINHTRLVLSHLKQAGVTLKMKYCTLFTKKIDYLGYVVRPGWPQHANHTTDAIFDVQIPATQTELRSIIFLCDVHRRFVLNYECIAFPLTVILRKKQETDFGQLNEEALTPFWTVQKKHVFSPILVLHRKEGRYNLDTIVCDRLIGCVLLQKLVHNAARPVGYWSKSLIDRERSLNTVHREWFVVTWAILLLRS